MGHRVLVIYGAGCTQCGFISFAGVTKLGYRVYRCVKKMYLQGKPGLRCSTCPNSSMSPMYVSGCEKY